jgi:hypothetical protein
MACRTIIIIIQVPLRIDELRLAALGVVRQFVVLIGTHQEKQMVDVLAKTVGYTLYSHCSNPPKAARVD